MDEKNKSGARVAGTPSFSADDEKFMRRALELAREAAEDGEVPVGAVVVWDDGRIVGEGRNRREKSKNALSHAEIEAIDAACRTLHGWRLHKATLYVTLEPCPMCAGAIVNARFRRVVFASADAKCGALGSLTDIAALPGLYRPLVEKGLFSDEAETAMKAFFSEMRKTKS